ncbi:hypothetical protein [Paraburkholderia sp. BCC1885]|uniref:hypothetical protein n=1 Tax=Paraburkholderia sp. BCC1885 TaxID=2562669 RepID=UPI0028CB27FB|nr:hypothetical protein [Paraburkholderia sp. BCC1885]
MSVLAGWQRGGWLTEQLVWVAIGVVLVAGAHLLPALCRSAPVAVRLIGIVLWLGCMGAASYGHCTFFLLSQFHAGEVRASAVPAMSAPPHRNLAAVMANRASVVAELVQANARRCIRDCPALQVRRTSLGARLDALDAESDDVRRYQVIEDGNAERRVTARDDPVTARLSVFYGIPEARLDLFAGLLFAAVLEGMACLLWWIALIPPASKQSVTDGHGVAHDVTAGTAPVTTFAQSPSPTTIQSTVPSVVRPTVTLPESDIARLRRDIESGTVKPTVAGIRQSLSCSQARASALRRQLADPAA